MAAGDIGDRVNRHILESTRATGGSGGGTTAWFATVGNRDAYYTDNPDKLASGTSCGVGTPVIAYTYDGTQWITGALAFQGPPGPNNPYADDSAKLGGKLPSEYATASQGAKADSALQSSQKGVANGVATLGVDSKVLASQLPEILPLTNAEIQNIINSL